jgi:hypothetical protein
MTDDPEPSVERWTFLGTRPGVTHAKVHVYRRPNGETTVWKKAISDYEIVGHLYDVMVSETDGTVTRHSRAEWLNERADDYEAIILDDRAEQRRLAKDQLARNAKRQDVLKEACEPIVAIAAKVVSQAQRQALIDYVTRAIYNA